MDSEPVKLWRDLFKLNLSASWKADVEKTVTDIELWRKILSTWFWIDAKGKKHKKSPGIKQLLDEYDRLNHERKSMEAADSGNNEADALSARRGERISTGGDSDVSEVWRKPPSIYFGTR